MLLQLNDDDDSVHLSLLTLGYFHIIATPILIEYFKEVGAAQMLDQPSCRCDV